MKKFEDTPEREYYIEENGKVYSRNKRDGKISEKATTLNKKRGYIYCRTSNKNYAVHKLVAQYFVPNPQKLNVVDHIDGNKLNNNYLNLEWVTYKENTRRAKEKGLLNPLKKGSYKKYQQKDYDLVEKLIGSGLSYTKAGEAIGMPYSTVAHYMRGSRGTRNANS